jgi:Flp pilus assembly protein TadB
MGLYFMLMCGAAVGLGVALLIAGFSGRQVLPRPAHREQNRPATALGVIAIRLAVAAVVGIAGGLFTGWPVVAIGGFGGTFWALSRNLTRRRKDEIARTEAIATWADSNRDSVAGTAEIQQAVLTSAGRGPLAIRDELTRFRHRARHTTFHEALYALGEELQHPSADLVVVALANVATVGSAEATRVLARLGEAIRADVRMRTRLEVNRSQIRTGARIVMGTAVAVLIVLTIFGQQFLSVYDDAFGQLLLVCISGFFVGGWVLMGRLERIEVPERFSVRRVPGGFR